MSLLFFATLAVVLLGLLFYLAMARRRRTDRQAGRLFRGEIRKYRELAEAIHRISHPVLNRQLLKELLEEKLQTELGASETEIVLGEAEPPQDRSVYPLQSGDRRLGYLRIQLPDRGLSEAEKEAKRLLANEISLALERAQLLEGKLRMERELARKSHMEDLGRMAAAVAHNVRNPLSSMKTLLQLFREAPNLTREQADEVAMMIGEVDRLSKTVSNLLRFSRPERSRGDSSVHLQPVKAEDVIRWLRHVFRGDLESRQLRLEAELASPAVFRSDPDFLSDILSNLLSNAIEASPPGATIRLRSREQDGQVVLSVEDVGPGVAAAVRHNLFEPFVTTKARGTGLGLAIVKKRVEQLGGSIECTSPVSDRGTRFTVRLPRLDPESLQVDG